ncbi:MAG: hypothetical protein H0S85_16155 [Desulfovibrionaceae bacterium]|jgi:uncharacterized protein|nr:hypothetical protein [Desulfovibrionaceae bacterium]
MHRATDAIPAPLRAALAAAAPFVAAVSGGIDSRVLAHCAARLGLAAHLLHFTGPHLTPHEAARAQAELQTLAALGLPHTVLRASPLDVPQAATNTRDRCYHCKRNLFSRARALADSLADSPDGSPDGSPNAAAARWSVIDGSNADDFSGAHGVRPGHRALAELRVASPLAQAGLTKADIRALARTLGLPEPDQPARACLLTRLDYDTPATADLLGRLGQAEDALASLGLRDFRVRVLRLAATTARPATADVLVQVVPAEARLWSALRHKALDLLEQAGFRVASEATDGPISGFFDRQH